jgi:hypothetical protein
MYEEWWIGPTSGDPSDIAGWRRPYFDDRAFPHDIWAMGQPVVHNGSLVWVDRYDYICLYNAEQSKACVSVMKMQQEEEGEWVRGVGRRPVLSESTSSAFYN